MKNSVEITYENINQILEASGVHKQVRSKVAKLLIGSGGTTMTLGDMKKSYADRKKKGTLKTTGGMKAGKKTQTDAEAVLTFLTDLKPGKPKK